MKFSRLKITGFKSFCDESELEFLPGISGIVGPNGCGKSNLVEALRWVMGESSYKAMRASNMDDVIFSGSINRPSRNSAEVSLIIDNSERKAPAALNNADILEISRRIERESGSAYRVNGREVRARDVQLLFADASTGSKSPSLVRQGQISELIAAKPVQRRALLEEAAGISGLHSRRHEAELRLRAAEQNLERVDDVVAQIEEQLASLKRQSRLAIRYRNISGEIRKNEALLYYIRWVNARHEQKNIEAEQGKLIKKLADATHNEQQANRVHQENDKRLAPLRENEAKIGAKLQRLKILAEQLEQELAQTKNRQIELVNRKEQICADIERETNLLNEADEIILNAKNEREKIEKQFIDENEQIAIAKEISAKIKQKLANIENEAQIGAQKLAEYRAKKQQALSNLQEEKNRLNDLKQQQIDLARKKEEINALLQNNEAIKLYQEKLEKAQQSLKEAEKDSIKIEKELAKKREKIEEIRPLQAKYQSQLSKLESEAATLSKILNIENNSLWPLIIDEINVKAGYESAIGAALGEDLEASLDKTAPIFWDLINNDVDDAPLPDGVVNLTKFVSGPKILNRRLKQTGLVEKDDGAKLQSLLKPGQRLVSKEGDLWRWDGFVAVAGAPTAATKRLEQKNRLKELDKEINNAKQKCSSFNKKLTDLIDEQNILQEKKQKEKEKWRFLQNNIANLQTQLEEEKKSLLDFTAKHSAILETEKIIEQNIKNSIREIEEGEKLLNNIGDEKEILQNNELLQNELNALRAESEQAQLKLNELENNKKLQNERIKLLNKEIENWQQRKIGAQRQINILLERKREINVQLEKLDSSPDEFAKRKNLLLEDIEVAKNDYKIASDRLELALTQYRQSEKNLRQNIEELSKAREELARIEERLKANLHHIRQIEQTIVENLGVSAEETAQIAQIKANMPLADEQIVERKVERLKTERERLGGVNLGAERELAEVKEKLDIMLKDKEDLIGAISKLRTGISSLNKEGRARLNEAFAKVNAHFKTLFATLFGGGAAELKFVESDDPLEAGLEIIARPAGKKEQILTLLSGGEQALTAISLIFAVFLTNPAPICVLDEVDAPLDDANIERFCNLLDEMCKRTDTRFIIVTHNPITMSRCDRLFGVTMAERGVSQIVSVDLSEAKQVAQIG